MGKRGPAPDPTGRDAHGNDVAPPLDDLEPPDYLDLDAVAVWHRLAPSLAERGVLTAWDVDTLAVFVSAVVAHSRAVRYVNDRGVLVKQRSSMVKNPALQIVRDQAAVIATFATRFGLTPADRARLRIGDVDPDGAGATADVDPYA